MNRFILVIAVLLAASPLTHGQTHSNGRSVVGPAIPTIQVNQAPEILGQRALNIDPAVSSSLTLTLSDLYVADPDNLYPNDFTLSVQAGTCVNFSVLGNTVTETSPSSLPCELLVKVNDGTSDSPQTSMYVSTTRASHPIITGQQPLQTGIDTPFRLKLNHLVYTGGGNSVVVLPGPNYARFGTNIEPSAGFSGTLNIPVMITDITSASNIFEVHLSVVDPVNNSAPVITGQLPVIATVSVPTVIPFDRLLVTDTDNTYPAGFTMMILPGPGYNDDGTSITVYNPGTVVVPVKVSDGVEESNVFNLVVNVNTPPSPTAMGFSLTGKVGELFSYKFPPYLFEDAEGDPITYSFGEAQNLDISWLTFDPVTMTISGTPGSAELGVGVYQPMIIATDPHGASDFYSGTFIYIADSNGPPVLIVDVPDQVAAVETPYEYTIPYYIFSDSESESLNYELARSGGGALPSWLHFDPWQLHLYGTPPLGSAEGMTLELKAIDQNGLSEVSVFKLYVSATPIRNIVSYDPLDPITVPYGTPFANVPFPSTANVTYDDASTEVIPITFGEPGYDGNDPNIYVFGGEFVLTPGTTNSGFISPNVQVTVLKIPQSIAFNTLGTKTYGVAPFDPGATATSGLAITYTSSNPAVATASGNMVTIVGVGTTTITANQVGNSIYAFATPVGQPLTVNQASQSITFDAIATKTFGNAAFNPGATATSGLSISYTSSNTSVATAAGNMVTIVGAGTTTLTANQAGNANYVIAAPVDQPLVVNKASQTITFGALPNKKTGDPTFALTAASSSGLPVAYSSSNPAVATVSTSTVTIIGAGTTTITASQAGTSNYLAATDVERTLTVSLVTGIELVGEVTFAIYPNPVEKELHITWGSPDGAEIVVYQLDGKEVDRVTVSGMGAVLNVGGLARGQYVVSVCSKDRIRTTRFLKR